MNRPSFQSIDIWAEWEKDILMILAEALPDLCNVSDMKNDENDITVQLHKIILTVRYNNQRITFGNIVLQTQNQPVNALSYPKMNQAFVKSLIYYGYLMMKMQIHQKNHNDILR